jgi:hypothetical protein
VSVATVTTAGSAEYACFLASVDDAQVATLVGTPLPPDLDQRGLCTQAWAVADERRGAVLYERGPGAGVTSLAAFGGVHEAPSVQFVFRAGPLRPDAPLHLVSPLLAPGQTDAWLAFCHDVATSRREELEAQRDRIGMSEVVFLQRGERDRVVAVISGEDPWTEGERIGASDVPFDRWFVENLVRFHGLDVAPPDELPARNPVVVDQRRPATA